MQKITKEEPNFEYVKRGTKPVEIFIAEDGKEFKGYNAEWLCEEYEKLKRKNDFWDGIEKRDKSLPTAWHWYHPKTDVELLVVLYHMGMDDDYNEVCVDDAKVKSSNLKDYIKVGDWIGYDFQDGGDYRGRHDVYTLEYVKQSIKFIYELT